MKGKYLITTSEWFYAPDGKQYRAVWGEVKLLQTKDVLGLDPNRTTSNWTLQVGSDEEHILIGGCQINYSVKCDNKPNTERVEQIFEGKEQVCLPAIYIPGELINSKSQEAFQQRSNKTQNVTIDFLNTIRDLEMDCEVHRNRLKAKAKKIGVDNYQTIREPYRATYNFLDILWADGSETREILVTPI